MRLYRVKRGYYQKEPLKHINTCIWFTIAEYMEDAIEKVKNDKRAIHDANYRTGSVERDDHVMEWSAYHCESDVSDSGTSSTAMEYIFKN